MQTLKFSLITMTLALGFVVVSCQKDDENKVEDQNVTLVEASAYASDDATASNSFDEVYSEADGTAADLNQVNNWSNGTKTKLAVIDSFRTITITQGSGDTTVWPKTITITFKNWKTKRGHIFTSGTITLTQNMRMILSGAIRSLTISNLIIDDSIKIVGTKTITNKGLIAGKPTLEVKLEDGSVSNLNTSKAITRQFIHTRTWEEGFGTPFNILDDVYSIIGSASGINRFGLAYTSTIQEKLVIRPLCPWIVTGILEIKVEGKKPVTIDWGYGYNEAIPCDHKVKITYGDNVYNVE